MTPEDLEIMQTEDATQLQIVYVLTNPCMPGIIKIGRTGNLSARVANLSTGTMVPEPYQVAYAAYVDNAHFVERALHVAFAPHRFPGKEFFRMPVESAIAALSLAEVEQVAMEASDHEPTTIIAEIKQRSVDREYEWTAMMRAFEQAGKPISNAELATLMGVTPGEASKRCRSNIHLLHIEKCGKEYRIQPLKRTA